MLADRIRHLSLRRRKRAVRQRDSHDLREEPFSCFGRELSADPSECFQVEPTRADLLTSRSFPSLACSARTPVSTCSSLSMLAS